MRNDFYVYVWKRPCGTPFYVGKGRGDRAASEKSRSPVFRNIVAKIRANGADVVVERIFDGLTEKEAFSHEVALISTYGRKDNGTGILANLTDGGEGVSGLTEGARAKIGAAHKGRVLSEDHRKKLSVAKKGKAHSEESRARISAGNKGKATSEETRAKLSASISAARRRAPPSAQNKTGFKGVSFKMREQKFLAQIRTSGAHKRLGLHTTPEAAARAYDRAAYAAWGRDCYLNFPEDIDKFVERG